MIDTNTKLSVLADHEHPLKSANTHLVAAAATSGGELAPQGYLDTIDADHHDGSSRPLPIPERSKKGRGDTSVQHHGNEHANGGI